MSKRRRKVVTGSGDGSGATTPPDPTSGDFASSDFSPSDFNTGN